MINKRPIILACSIELMIAAVILLLVTLSCGIQTQLPRPLPGAISAPVPSVNTKAHTDTLTVTICGRWNIRPSAGDLNGHLGWLEDGTIETVKLPATVTPDMGMWYELADGGWVNARAVCEK